MKAQRRASPRGQTMVELALVFPLFVGVIVAITSLGLWVFYQQQLTNAAREAARYAAIHSATAQCPTVSTRPPMPVPPGSYYDCDRPADRWPHMTNAARNASFGLDRSMVHVSACWSGYHDAFGNYDALPTDPATGQPNTFVWCHIAGVDPRSHPQDIPEPTAGSCQPPITTQADDTSSDLAASSSANTSTVTVYACYLWHPPLGGYLGIADSVVLTAVITEPVRYQQ